MEDGPIDDAQPGAEPAVPVWTPPAGDAVAFAVVSAAGSDGVDEQPAVPAGRTGRRVVVAALVVVALAMTGVVALANVGDDAGRLASPGSLPHRVADSDLPPRTTVALPTTTIWSERSAVVSPTLTTSAEATPTPTAIATTTTSTEPPATAPPLDDEPSVVARPAPIEQPPPPPDTPRSPWADTVFTSAGGHVSTDVGCAWDTSAAGLDAFFAARVGPVLGWDYQHVYPLGGDRHLWLFQDTFLDHSNTARTLDKASFAHNTALVQDGNCFRLLHGGTTIRPEPFEPGTGTRTLDTWFWPMGGELIDDRLYVFWARMRKDAIDPRPPNGLGWHPDATFVATYDQDTMARLDFRQATQGGAAPIYGYVVQSDAQFTYLFANTFEQNLTREGGWYNGPHSGTEMRLGRVARGRVFDQPEYWTSNGWTQDRRLAEPFLQRHWAEFPFQPRLVDGQWVAVNAVNGYWGDSFELDVANNPWGPWTTVESRPLLPRGADPAMNTYHAHLMPWRDAAGDFVVSVSNNARDMLRDAWPTPARYRPMLSTSPWRTAPPDPVAPEPPTTSTPATSTPTTTQPPASTTSAPSTTTTTTTTTTTVTATTSSAATTSTTSAATVDGADARGASGSAAPG